MFATHFVSLAFLLVGGAPGTNAQVFGSHEVFDSASTCDIAQLDARIEELESVC
eukprot:SAG11_NODE_145_length_14811_cov_24.558931_3_plen_54_part_00